MPTNLTNLKRLPQRLASTTLKGRVIEHQLRSTQQNFDSESDPNGRPWQRLAPSTLKRKKGSRILTETTALRKRINGRQTARGVVIGVKLSYAAIHQFGGTIRQPARTQTLNFKVNSRTGESRFAKKSKANFQQQARRGESSIKIPARPYLGFGEDDVRQIRRIIAEEMTRSQ